MLKKIYEFGPKINIKFFSFLFLFVSISTHNVLGQITYTWTGATSTAWNVTGNWTKSSGTSTPGTVATDIVIIPTTATNQPTLSTTLATSIASLTFTSTTAATLTITGVTLNVSGAVTLDNGNNARACSIAGTGTLSCASLSVGSNVNISGTRACTFNSSISNLNISGSMSLKAVRDNGSGTRVCNPTFNQSGGTVSIGNISTTLTDNGGTDVPTCTYTMSGTTPTLNFTGATPFSLNGTTTNTFTFNSTGATVNYSRSGTQTVGVSGNSGTLTYTNLTLSGGNTKTLAANATASATLTVNANTTFANGGFNFGTPTSVVLECGASGSTISGSGTLTLGGNVSVNKITGTGAGAVISCPIALGATRTFTVADETTTVVDLTLSGIISGSTFGVTKLGAGTLELSGLNTYSGTTLVSAGILRATNNTVVASTNGPFGNNASALQLGGGTIQSNVATFSRPITVTVTNSGLDAYSSARTISSTITMASGTMNLNIGGTTAASAEGQNLTLSGIISNTAGTLSLTKIGTSTVILTAANTFIGSTTVSAGTLRLGASSTLNTSGPLGTTGAGTSVTSGASIDMNGFSLTSGATEALSINGTGVSGVGALTNSSSTASTYVGVITFATDATIAGEGGLLNITGTPASGTAAITLGGAAGGSITTVIAGARALTKENGGTWTLSGTNTFTGGTTLNSGTLNINNTQALGTSAGTFTINGGTINATTAGISTVAYPLALNGDFTFTGTNNLNLGTGSTTLNANRQITVSGGTLTIGGSISSASNNLTKLGGGTLSFGSNPVTLNDLTISAGTLTSTSVTLSLAGNFSNSGTFTHNSGTVDFNGSSAQQISGSAITFNDLNMSGVGTKTISNSITVAGNLSIDGGTAAILANGTSSTADALSLGGNGTVAGSWGGTSSAATNKNGTFFTTSATGIVTAATTSGSLPVKLISFEASRVSNYNILNWVTATELNNEKFEIERSLNGVDFIKIGEVDGNGNSNQIIKYSFIDKDAENQTLAGVYYRLKQVDFNGKFEYSNTIKLLKINSFGIAKPVVSPNPFSNQIKIELPKGSLDLINLKITSMNGVSVFETTVLVGKSNSIDVNTETLSSGIYFLSVNDNGIVTNYKVVKK